MKKSVDRGREASELKLARLGKSQGCVDRHHEERDNTTTRHSNRLATLAKLNEQEVSV